MTDCFSVVRVRRTDDIPKANDSIIDVVILDMNHNWPNLGHDCIVENLREMARSIQPSLEASRTSIRAVSYDVRGSLMIPEPPGNRFQLYIGTGGPGHLDPAQNDGLSDGSQGIVENPAWQAPLFSLFDAIHRNTEAALLAVCHTFGLLCMWSGAARPVIRGPEKGGKSSGVVETVLTEEALRHPWFSRLSAQLSTDRRIQVLDSRLFDLIPKNGTIVAATLIGKEVLPDGREGDALTMLEFASDHDGTMPRIFAVNFHPEIVNRRRLLSVLKEKFASGEVSEEWYGERAQALSVELNEQTERALDLTSQYTFLLPVQHHLFRQARSRGVDLS